MTKKKIALQDIVPFAAFFIIFVFFAIASRGRMLSSFNLKNLLNQSLMTIIVGCGAVFVVSQGSIDLSVGVNLALSGVIATWVAETTGLAFLLIPAALAVGLIVGLFNGVMVSRFKVPSFMLTIAMLIGVRGIVNYIQTVIGTQHIPESMLIFNEPYLRFPLFVLIVTAMAYIFERTKLGRYSRAIGENETAARFVGVPVTLIKTAAFGISGLMAGLGSIFSLTSIGGTTQQMGVFFEMQVAMAIFLGGVLVTGGTSAKIYKVLLGSFSITIIVNGLALIGMSESQISESVEGVLLLLILFITIKANNRHSRITKASPDSPEKPDAAKSEESQIMGS